ncbi:hypothetical protein CVT25_007742 [Psilocybe cyanescens]|uniref:Extracellular membrane protein CFEM domain-containing protein n=1 Tax=Psilocybe cyanescens TaxID=93625 RepID=A0A409XHX6_PSICY|nr:hypothetical protein CVT25_007742 [Psilocybe cyanescens]
MHSGTARATLLASFLWVSQVLAIVPRSPFRDSLILPRQTACDSACAVFTDALNGCTTLGCLCTPTVAQGLQNCVDCAVTASPTADVIANAQALVGTYSGQCTGFGLPPVTVKSGSGGGPSTSPPVKTSTTITPLSVTTSRTSPAVPITTSTPPITTPTITNPNFPTNPSISQSTVHPFTSVGITGGPGQGIPSGQTSKGMSTHSMASLGAFGLSLLFGVLLAF